MSATNRHVSVCVCTFKRPELLRNLLRELEHQQTEGLFNYSVVVADNDINQSAKQTVADFQNVPGFDVTYVVEPEQNIALARNVAIRNAKGDFIAIIDDDEYPPRDWLLRLVMAYDKYQADGILGPVLSQFEENPPRWITEGKFFEGAPLESGTVLKWTGTRTSNALLRREIFEGKDCMFRPEYGDGGEDKEFFRRMINNGRRFIWCSEAPVTEVVARERCTRSYLLRRALQRGGLPPHHIRGYRLYFNPLVAFPLYTTFLPFLLVMPHHIFMKYLIRDCHHIGRILRLMGIQVFKKGYVQK